MTDSLVSIGKAAQHLGVSVDTVRRWSNDGRLPVIVLPSGHRRYRVNDLNALISRRAS